MNCNAQKPPGDRRLELQYTLQLPEGGRGLEKAERAVLECGSQWQKERHGVRELEGVKELGL